MMIIKTLLLLLHIVPTKKNGKMICKHGETIVFQKVPALACDNCDEKYVDGKITTAVLQEANAIIARGEKVDIREFGLVA